MPNFGGDIETLLLNCKIVHSRRLTKKLDEYKVFSVEDIKRGFDMFVDGRDYKNKENDKEPPFGMYL
jgi:hypothetical protein